VIAVIVYLDSYFLENFLFDLLLLMVTAGFAKIKFQKGRGMLAAAIGSLYSCIALVCSFSNGAVGKISAIATAGIMVLTEFGRLRLKQCIKVLCLFYTAACLGSGIMYTIAAYCSDSMLLASVTVGILCIVVKGTDKKIRRTYSVILRCQGKTVYVTAITDTGNNLTEPITGRPVHVVAAGVWEQLKSENEPQEGAWIIPYRSMGKRHGLLVGKQLERMVIKGEYKDTVIEKPIVVCFRGQLSKERDYEMLLHPAVAEGCNDAVRRGNGT
jgi:sigma-E processing peptidase SpoIIGA